MPRTIIITQEQLNEIVGRNYEYFDDLNGAVPEYAGHNETFANSPKGKPIRGKDVSDAMGKSSNWWASLTSKRGMCGIAPVSLSETFTKEEFEKKTIEEINQALKHQRITTGYVNNPANGEVNTISGTEGSLAVKKTQLKEKVANGDVNAKKEYDAIDNTLKSRRNNIKNIKQSNANILGMNNQFQKVGGKKISGNGKAHTKKQNNITYFE